MTLTIYGDIEQRTPEWLALRNGMVTASMMGKLVTARYKTGIDYECPDCGVPADKPCVSLQRGSVGKDIKTLHSARTAAALAHRSNTDRVIEVAEGDEVDRLAYAIAAERLRGFAESVFVNFDMWRGTEVEHYAVEKYAEHYAPVTRCGFMERDDWGFSIGWSPDGLVGADGAIEIKGPRGSGHVRSVVDDEVPAAYMPQLQTALLVSGRQWIDFVSYAEGLHVWPKRVTPDKRWQVAIVEAAARIEKTIAVVVATYRANTVGMPMAERLDLEVTAS
jgi:hypothetical protein